MDHNKKNILVTEAIYTATVVTMASILFLLHSKTERYEKEKTEYPASQSMNGIDLVSTTDIMELNTLLVKENPSISQFNIAEEMLYRENAKVIYQDQLYSLKNLYRLTKEEESYLCYLDPESYYYYDMDTNAAIAINGYEELFHYNIESLLPKFPYNRKYGTPEESIISEEEFLNKLEHNTEEKQVLKK